MSPTPPRKPAVARDSSRPQERAPPSLSETIALHWQAERSDLDLQAFLLAVFYMRLGTLVDRAYDKHCQREYGINGGDMRVMLALRRSGPPYAKRPTDLFRTLLVTSGAITKKVDRLVERGYVGRLSDPTHAGGFLVHLTKTGLRVVDRATEHLAVHSTLAPALSTMTAEERREGYAFTLKILAALERKAIDDEAAEAGSREQDPG